MSPTSSADRLRVPLIVACTLFMEHLDSTIIATALPAIARSTGEDPLHLSLAITAYLLSLAIGIPVSGWMADRFGARSVFRAAIAVFVLGSIGCAFASGMATLVIARTVQGLGGAMMVPVGRLVLLREVDKRDLVGAMSFLTIPALTAPILAPLIGGLIVTYLSWRWIFLINVPIGAVGIWLVSRYVRDLHDDRPPPLDLRGWLLLSAGLVGTMFGFENLGKHLLPSAIAPLALGVGMLSLYAYVAHARRVEAPILRLSLLRVATFRASVTGGTLFRIGVGAFSVLLPMLLQLGFGFSALESGSITFATALGSLFMKTLAERFTRRYGFRRLLLANTAICSAALLVCGLIRPAWPGALIIGFLFVTGFVRSLQFTCLNAMAFADVDTEDMSQATSFSATAQQLAISVGVGVGVQLLNLSLALRAGSVLTPADFTLAFTVVALISLAAALSFRRLAADAGSSVSGHIAAD